MQTTKTRFFAFNFALAIVWFLLRNTMHELFAIQGEFKNIGIPVVGFGLPSAIFFFIAGIVFALIINRDLAQWTASGVAAFCLIQVGYIGLFTHVAVYSVMGFFVLISPIVGTVVGGIAGIGLVWLFRRLRTRGQLQNGRN